MRVRKRCLTFMRKCSRATKLFSETWLNQHHETTCSVVWDDPSTFISRIIIGDES